MMKAMEKKNEQDTKQNEDKLENDNEDDES